MKKILILIALFGCAHLSAQIDRSKMPEPGPTPEINIGDPQKFDTDNGITVLLVENNKLPRVSVNLRIDNKPQPEGEKAGVGSLLGSLLGKGSANIPMEEFYDEVDFMGASVNVSSSGGSANSLTRYFPRVFELFADAALNPNFTQEEFEKEKDELLSGLKTAENSVPAAASRVGDLVTFGADHPYGEYVSEETVNNVSLDDIKELYKRNFNVNKAYLVFVGNITIEEAKKLTNQHFGSWTTPNPYVPQPLPTPENPTAPVIEFVDMPNAVQSEIFVSYTDEIAKTNPDYFAILTTNQILGGGAEARLFLNLREDKGYTYGAYSFYEFDHDAVETFSASTSVRNLVTDSAVVQILYELDKLKTQPVSIEELDLVRSKYTGSFVRSLENPSTIANYAYQIITEGLPHDFYRTFLQNIENVSVEDVRRVAQTYFPSQNARIIVTGKGADILEDLENIVFNDIKLGVNYYDKWGNSIPRPTYEQVPLEGVSTASIIDSYIEAIGGRQKLETIKTSKYHFKAEFQGALLDTEVIKSTEGKSLTKTSMGQMVFSKSVVTDEQVYNEIQGQREYVEGAEKESSRIHSYPFPELNLDADSLQYVGITDVGDDQAYEIKISDNLTHFYDTDTHLLTQMRTTTQIEGSQIAEETIRFIDYKAVDGILIPHVMLINQMGLDIEFNLTGAAFNTELDDSIFE